MTLWRNRAFLTYWTASAISDVGSQVTALALPLIGALTLSATPWQMGILTASTTLPILLVGLFAGVWVDRLRRRPVLIAADVGRAVVLLTIPLASVRGMLTIELLCTVALLVGAMNVFFDLAHLAVLPALVEREHLVDGNAKLEITAAGAQVAGPSLGGALVGALGAPFAVLVDALSFAVSGLLIQRVRVAEPPPAPVAARPSMWAEIREGFRLVLAQPMLRAIMAASATMNFFGRMFLAVYVLYMTRDLGLSPVAIGLILATGGIGSLAGALVTGPLTKRFGPGPMLVLSQLAFGLTGLLVPLAILVPKIAIPMLVASEFGQWMAVIVYYVNAVSIRQAITADQMQGRVNATIRFLGGGMLPIGALVGGAVGGVIGLPWTLVIAELGALLGFVWLVLSPVRSLRALPSVGHAMTPHDGERVGA
jgi:MFS family permease